jgi:hypothetical protein
MVGQLIRVAEAPISISISVARKSLKLTGRVAGWALTEVVAVLSPDGRDGSFAADTEPESTSTYPADADTESTSTWEPDEDEPVVAIEEEAEVVSVIEEELEAVTPTGEEEAAAKDAAEEETLPSDAVAEEEAMVGGEDRAVVEHEPGTGTSDRASDPHSALNNPVTEPDLTEWPDPYDHREDPRDPGEEMVFGGEGGHTQTGATSTSEPHPSQDPEVETWEGPKRDKLDR